MLLLLLVLSISPAISVRAGPVACLRSQLSTDHLRLSQLLAGLTQDLRLEAPGGSFDKSSSHYLKLFPDASGTFQESDCSQIAEHLNSQAADQVTDGSYDVAILTWSHVQVTKPGWYAACYCENTGINECKEWQHLGSYLVSGTSHVHGGDFVAPWLRFPLHLQGFGFSATDRLLLREGTNCITDEVGLLPEPLLGSGGKAFQVRQDGERVRLELTEAHGLIAGDVLRFSNLTIANLSNVTNSTLGEDIKCILESPIAVIAAPSQMDLVLDVSLTDDELGTVDFSSAGWVTESTLTFEVHAIAAATHSVCWAEAKLRIALLEIKEPPLFRSELHLTTSLPKTLAPSVLAFQSNAAAHGVTRIALAFRDQQLLGHAFIPQGEPSVVSWQNARQDICGQLFRELWSEDEDGFPQPSGCYYSPFSEYGMVFPVGRGPKAGVKYQVVMLTQLRYSVYTEHEWRIFDSMVPLPPIQPVEAVSGDDMGDIGEQPSMEACWEECVRLTRCTVAVYRRSDRHCVVADLRRRELLQTTADGSGSNVTMFLMDRLNGTSLPERAIADLWSLEDSSRPWPTVKVAEASMVKLRATPRHPALAQDPRWAPFDGLKIVDLDGQSAEGPMLLTQLALRLRTAQGSILQAGDLLRLYMWPLTSWDLKVCEAQCVPQSPAMSCVEPTCHAESLFSTPFKGGGNVLEFVLPDGMEPITNHVMHTIVLRGPHFRLPPGGFMPTRLAGELFSTDRERRVSYAESVGLLPFVPVKVVGGVLQPTGSEPFADDVRNDVFLRFRLASALHSRGNLSASLTIMLPVGYTVREVGAVDLPLWSRQLSSSQMGDAWLCSTRFCTLTLHNAVIYTGYIVVHFLVDNPMTPLKVNFEGNRWRINITGPGDAENLVSFPEQTLEPPSSQASLVASTAVLGRITLPSLLPSSLWQGAFRSLARVFLRTQQGWVGEFAVQMIVPKSFGFDDPCFVQDLPEPYYRPRQGLLGPTTSMEEESGVTLHRIPRVTRCLARRVSSFANASDEDTVRLGPEVLPHIAEVYTTGPMMETTMYGFAIFIRHSSFTQGGNFQLATFIQGENWEMLDRVDDVPLMPFASSVNLFAEAASAEAFVAPMLPFALTGKTASVRILLRPMVSDSLIWQKVSWRVFAPHTYVWDFASYNFFFRHSQVPGSDTDLPIVKIPSMPRTSPLNLLVFQGADEASPGWVHNSTYGFRAAVQVPTQTPRHSVNEWVVEWGFGEELSRAGAIAQGQEVRAIHSFQVWCMGSRVRGHHSQILLEFGMETEVGPEGMLKLRTPEGFALELWEISSQPLRCEPFTPLAVFLALPVDNSSSTLLLKTEQSIRAGRWCFAIAGPLPEEATSPVVVTSFVLESLVTEQDVADVAAVTEGFHISRALAFAGLVNTVDYFLSGRDDHPEKASRLIFAFELQERPKVIGNFKIEVIAPTDYTFHKACSVRTGIDIFGPAGYPALLSPFEASVQVLHCSGYRNIAKMEVTPGLHAGRRYAFSLRVDAQPDSTPEQVLNVWYLNVADEATAAPIPGYTLWSFLNLELGMLVQTVNTENEVTILFQPTNTITSKDHLEVEAPQGFSVSSGCEAQVQQLSLDSHSKELDIDLPGIVCTGQQPPTNHFQVHHAALLAGGVRYRLSVLVWNPTSSSSSGSWLLRSYREDGQLLDVGEIPSLALSRSFNHFEVAFRARSDELSVMIAIELPQVHPLDSLIIVAPDGFSFEDSSGSTCRVEGLQALPTPRCRGPELHFEFTSLISGHFNFWAHSAWPTQSLSGQDAFTARLENGNSILASGRAPLQQPFAPRFRNFTLQRSHIWAQALSSAGKVRLTFMPQQDAEVIELVSRLERQNLGLNLAVAEVISGLVMEVFHPSPMRILLAGLFTKSVLVELVLDTINPEATGHVYWTLRSFSRPRPKGALVTAEQAAQGPLAAAMAAGQVPNHSGVSSSPWQPSFEEVLKWLDWSARGRDEIQDFEATAVHGLLVITSSFLESNFFDSQGTEVSFQMTLRPGKAAAGQSRFLIFAPENWTFVPDSFQGFPVQDLGILDCWQRVPALDSPWRWVPVYALRLLEDLSSMIPCRFNDAKDCENVVSFRFRADTPVTPDKSMWQESSQAWLLHVDAFAGSACGPVDDQLDDELLRFTNDAHFFGFPLKESIGVRVVPSIGPNVPRKATLITVDFECRSPLVAEGDLLLRVEAPLGIEFDRGCLAAPDPEYLGCAGLGRVAVAQRREVSLQPGQHSLSLRAINPVRTVAKNWWTLGAFVDVSIERARAGAVEDLRQQGRGDGYQLDQQLQARVRPSSQQSGGPISLFLWLRPKFEVEAGGHVELHAAQGFEMSCQPALVLLAVPPGRCKAYHVTSGVEYTDDHDVIDFEISQGYSLLPEHEYELSVSSRNPFVPGSSRWGVLLRDELRQVLEANMEIDSYTLTDFGFELLSLQPSISAPNASNEVRLQLRFQRQLVLTSISEIRIEAPSAWNFEPLCNRFQDITGGCETRCSFQLPYAEERGHHLCEANLLILVLDTSAVIDSTSFTLLFSVVNPASAPSQNLWSVSLVNAFAEPVVKHTELLIPGFFIGFRQKILPALPNG